MSTGYFPWGLGLGHKCLKDVLFIHILLCSYWSSVDSPLPPIVVFSLYLDIPFERHIFSAFLISLHRFSCLPTSSSPHFPLPVLSPFPCDVFLFFPHNSSTQISIYLPTQDTIFPYHSFRCYFSQ